MKLWRILLVLTIGLVLLAGSRSRVEAQEGDALRFFQQNPSRSLFRALPQNRPELRRNLSPNESSEPRGARRRSPEGDAAAGLAEPPPVPPSVFVHVIGDSLSELLAQGLKEQFADTKPEVGIVKRSRASSGLVREDYYDWSKTLREALAGPDKFDMIVMMLGSNDRQALRDDAGSHEFGTDRWRQLYVRRLDDILSQARDKNIPFVIVGMPVMQGPRLSADMLALNMIFKEQAARGGAGYIDVWEAFASEQGQYAASGPDVNGEIVRLRTGDGVHFTRAGARKLGFFAGREIAEQLGRIRPPATETAALPTDLSEQIRRDSPGLAPQALQGAVLLPAALPELPAIGQRPLAGPTTALTTPPQSVGGELLRRRIVAPADEIGILVEQAFAYGRLPPSKPGRADDFAWPRTD